MLERKREARVRTEETTATWRADLDTLAFKVAGHEGWCMVHRLAFRTLIGRDPDAEACTAFHRANAGAFAAAALLKIARKRLPSDASLHLTSRDVARRLGSPSSRD
jgi:hypothetical protein